MGRWRARIPLSLLASLTAGGMALGWEAGMSLDDLKSLHHATADQRAQAEEAARKAPPPERVDSLPKTPHITPAARLPFEPDVPAPLPLIPPRPMEAAAPVQMLDTTCNPYVRVARASPVTGSFLLDAPCLANQHLLAVFGDNPGHPFVVGEYGGAEFIFAAPDFPLYPIFLVDPQTGQEKLLQDGPDTPILVFTPGASLAAPYMEIP